MNRNLAQLKIDFLRIYSNLPLGLRDQIIYVVKGKGPVTWVVVYLEVDNDSPYSAEILQGLADLKII